MFWENALEILFLSTVVILLLFVYYKYCKKEKKPFQLYFKYYVSLMLLNLFIFTIQAHSNEHREETYIKNYNEISVCNEFDKNSFYDIFYKMRIKEELFFLSDVENSISEYNQMKTLLLEAQSHYDLAALYQEVLDNG